MARFWYASIVTENDGSWYGKFKTKRERDEFCEQDCVWVLRNAHHDWRGGMTGTRERVPARIFPTTAAAVRSNMSKSVHTYW